MTQWKSMTDEEKGALLLAVHKGEALELKSPGNVHWLACRDDPKFNDNIEYRKRPVLITKVTPDVGISADNPASTTHYHLTTRLGERGLMTEVFIDGEIQKLVWELNK